MGTLDATIHNILDYNTKENLLEEVLIAQEQGKLKLAYDLLIDHIQKNKAYLKIKPQDKKTRADLNQAFHILNQLKVNINTLKLPKTNPQSEQAHLKLKDKILSFFSEKNWQKQCDGKFGGPKPTYLNWEKFYKNNERKLSNIKSKDEKIIWSVTHGHTKILLPLIKKEKIRIKKHAATLLEIAIKNNFNHITKLLVENGASVKKTNKEKWSPLHWSCLVNDIEISQYLLNNEAKVNIKTETGLMPIHIAAINGNNDLIKLLKKHKSHLNIKEKTLNLTPIQLAFLQEHDSAVEQLIECDANINVQNMFGQNLLHWSAMTKNTNLAEKLLTLKCNPNNTDQLNRSPAHWAAQNDANEILSLLIEHKADLSKKDKFEDTPLLTAAFFSNHKSFSSLFEESTR